MSTVLQPALIADSKPLWEATMTVYGEVQSQGSKKPFKLPSGQVVMVESSKKLKPWRQEVKAEMNAVRPAVPLDAALELYVCVYQSRPAAHYGTGKNAGVLKPTAPQFPKTGRDIDKVSRAVFDAGTGTLWINDARICALTFLRRYDDGGGERIVITARQLEL